MTMARITIYVMLSGVKIVNFCRQSCAMRGDLRGRQRWRRDYIMTMASVTIYVMLLGDRVVNYCRQSCAMRCNSSAGAGAGDLRGHRRRRRDSIMAMDRFTVYVMLLGVKGVNSCRQSCAMRCNLSAGAVVLLRRAPAQGLHHDYGQIHHLCNVLGVKGVNSCRQTCAMRGNLRGRGPAPGLHHDYG